MPIFAPNTASAHTKLVLDSVFREKHVFRVCLDLGQRCGGQKRTQSRSYKTKKKTLSVSLVVYCFGKNEELVVESNCFDHSSSIRESEHNLQNLFFTKS